MSSYMVNGQEFYHHGIKGMKWGVRRFQTKDGSLTPAGKKRYAKEEYKRAEDKAFSRYEKTIASIEKNYKRGQNLSEKDLAREEAADKRYQAESAKAKAAYKQAKAQIKSDAKKNKSKSTAKNAKKKVSKGKKRANATLKKIGQSTVKSTAKTASIGAQMAIRMFQNNMVYTQTGWLFD